MLQQPIRKPSLAARPIVYQALGSIAATLVLTTLALRPDRLTRALEAAAGARPHLPHASLLAAAPPAVQAHVLAVIAALAVGVVLMTGVKGNRLHRALGWTWVVAMATAAVSSLFIRQINPGGFSFLHLFAGWTLVALPVAVVAARMHKVRLHSRTMTGLFVGGLLVAGVTAFLPGRLMWRIFFG